MLLLKAETKKHVMGTWWAAGEEPPIKTNCPPAVELVTHTKRTSLAVFLVNQTTNQMGKNAVIRSVVPIKDVEVHIKTAAPAKAVHTATGQRARYERNGGWLQVRLSRLDEYDVLLIDLASQ